MHVKSKKCLDNKNRKCLPSNKAFPRMYDVLFVATYLVLLQAMQKLQNRQFEQFRPRQVKYFLLLHRDEFVHCCENIQGL